MTVTGILYLLAGIRERSAESDRIMSNSDVYLILHGWGGNKPAHWQEHLFAALTAAGETVLYPKFPEPTAPDLPDWKAKLKEVLAEIPTGRSLTVVCHSLGAINWLHYAASGDAQPVADRVLLVAPPYVIPEIPPTDAPPGVGAFFPPPLSGEGVAHVARETHIIATDSDDYATFEQTKAYADRLGIPIHMLAGAGHISPYWGYGEWPWVLDWCQHKAEFPPQPNKPAA
jgi:predicted alpha/beta hydrolase family esterase